MDKPKHIIAKELNGKVIVEFDNKQAEVSDELEKIIRSFVYDNCIGRVHIKFQQGIDISSLWDRIEINTICCVNGEIDDCSKCKHIKYNIILKS